MPELFHWDNFTGYDDTTIIPVNLTAREMALILSAISVLTDVDVWGDSFNYYNDVVPMIETIQFILRNV
jgi:hypothetical protein